MKVIVIGGGASGMMAALQARKNQNDVLLLEKKEQVGKKILVTGNGHANLTHKDIQVHAYHADSEAFMDNFLHHFSTDNLIEQFGKMNLPLTEKDGYFYPLTNQAQTVVYAFTEALAREKVDILLNTNVTDVKKENNVFFIFTNQGVFQADKVIFACGSEASVKDKNAFSAYDILKKFGHTIKKPLPALTALVGAEGVEDFWAGVRIKAKISYKDLSECGELQLTKNGISGIPVMNLSHAVISDIAEGKKAFVSINFMPDYSHDELLQRYFEIKNNAKEVFLRFEGIMRLWFPDKMGRVFAKKLNVSGSKPFSEFTDDEITKLVDLMQSFPYEIKGYGSFMDAQVCQGGVLVSEINDTFE